MELDQNMHFYKEKNEELVKKEKLSQGFFFFLNFSNSSLIK
jgi:hypothetical protein